MDFYLCQFGFEDVGLLRLLLTARHTGSQTTTCGNKRTNWDTRTSTIWSIWFVQHPFTFRVLSAFRCCPDNERKRSNNTKSDTAPRSLKNNAEDNCYKSSHRVWTGTCPYSCLFMGSGSVHNVQRMEWKNKKKCHLWNIHLPTRAQGDCGRTLALTHTHTHGRFTGEVRLESLTEMFIKECRRRARGITVARFFLRLNSARLSESFCSLGHDFTLEYGKIRVLDISWSFGIVKG